MAVVPDSVTTAIAVVTESGTRHHSEYHKGWMYPMKTPDEIASQTNEATLMESFSARRSRRSLLKGVAAGAVGATSLGAAGLLLPRSTGLVHAAAAGSFPCNKVTPIHDIFTIARTAERLAVTFYENGVSNAGKLGLSGANLEDIHAALIEEQIHERFFAAAGGGILASTFSFPHGPDTFVDLSVFIATQQELEGVFDSAFLSAIREFAQQGRIDLAQIAGQIATIESEHRALGRQIGGLSPADNWVFAPVLIPYVGAAPAIVKKAGFLSPRKGNSYTYQPVETASSSITFRTPFQASC